VWGFVAAAAVGCSHLWPDRATVDRRYPAGAERLVSSGRPGRGGRYMLVFGDGWTGKGEADWALRYLARQIQTAIAERRPKRGTLTTVSVGWPGSARLPGDLAGNPGARRHRCWVGRLAG